MSENELVAWLRRRIRAAGSVQVGPGDDAAVLVPSPGSRIVVTVDAFLEGSHFPSGSQPAKIGHKVIAASVSDIAAMGCYPSHCLVTLGLNEACGEEFVHELGEAMIAAAEKYGAPVAGGDVTSGPSPLVVSVTVLGETRGLSPVLRSGARAGDRIFVTGSLGGSLLGRHFEAEPRIEEGLFLNRNVGVTAMIDVSDGLSTDLNHIAAESEVGALISETAIPVSDDARELERQDGVAAIRHALEDGEDFELLFTVPAERTAPLRESWPFDVPVTEIGEMGGDQVLIERADGTRQPLEPRGYEHTWSGQ